MQIVSMIMLVLVGLGLYKATQKRYEDAAKNVDTARVQSPIESIEPDLQSKDWRARLAAVKSLHDSADESAIADLLAALSDEDSDVRETARTALETFGGAAVSGLLDVLREGSLEARIEAAQALGTIGDPAAVDGLSAALTDESEWVRDPAVNALRLIGTPAARSALEQHTG